MSTRNRTPFRIIGVSIVFVFICLIYIVRMVNIRVNAAPKQDNADTYVREEKILAVRGEIYDRNGVKLVSNKYSYNFVFDYEAMSVDRKGRNIAILAAVNALENTDNMDKRVESSFPFSGEYPNYSYSEEALDTNSNIYYRLLKRIAQNELEDESPKNKQDLTAAYLEEFYKESPEAFPKASEIVDYYIHKYKLDETDKDKNRIYENSCIDKIFRVVYDMEVNDFSPYTPYILAKDVDMSFITHVKEKNIVGSTFNITYSRVYNYPGYASHILGRTGRIYEEDWEYYNSLGYEMNAIVGVDGCEYAFEEYLRGVDGIMIVTEDKKGNVIDRRIETPAIAGKDVYLTIDINLQIAAEDGLRDNIEYVNMTYGAEAEAGAAIALDPHNGGVLAIASYPTYDLTTFSQDYDKLASDKANPLNNRALLGLYAPGSTFKLGMVAAGIHSGVVDANTKINCTGAYAYYDHPKCWVYPGNHGNLDASGAIEVSCNCYFYEIGRLMGIEVMNDYCKSLGFAEKTGIELYEAMGNLAGPDSTANWNAGETIRAAIGQSTNTFTPIQLASYVSTLLNGGERYATHLLFEVREYGTGEVYLACEKNLLSNMDISNDVLDPIKLGMKKMIESSSNVNRYMKGIPVTVGGKTGTAQLGGGIVDNGLFVCAAPYNDPDITICTIVEKAGGGSYSARCAADILKAFYGVE